MVALTDQLRRLKVDYYEYIALKVIVLLSSNGGEWPSGDQRNCGQTCGAGMDDD